MEPPKAAYVVGILVLFCCFLQQQEYTEPVKSLFEKLMSKNPFSAHGREKRETNQTSIDYNIEVYLSLSDLEHFRRILSNISIPVSINDTGVVTNINVTTECSSNLTEYQCTCNNNYAWSYNQCISYGACDAIIGDKCGCIKALPTDQFCQLNTTQTVMSTTPGLTTTPPVYIDVDIDLRFSAPILSSNIIDEVKRRLGVVAFPYSISPLLEILNFNITTGCNNTQCQCGDQFAWSCDKCQLYGACDNISGTTCSCINAIPEGEFCEPISNVPSCSTPPPVTTAELPSTTLSTLGTPITVTTAPPTTATTEPSTTEPSTTVTTAPPTTATAKPSTTVSTSPSTTVAATPSTSVTATPSATVTSTPSATVKATPSTTVTTAPSTTVTTAPSTTVTTAPSTTVTRTTLKFTMDLEYKEEYNAQSNTVYQTIFDTIGTSCRTIVNTCSVDSLTFSSGSTVATFTISAASINSSQIQQINDGIINGVLTKYPIIIDGDSLQFSTNKTIVGTPVDITCQRPDQSLNFGQIEAVTWTIDGAALNAETTPGTLNNGTSKLTGFRFSQTGQVPCVCLLRVGNKILRRKGTIDIMPKPEIKVTTLRDVVLCGTQAVTLTCSVQSPYKVKFENSETAGQTVQYTYPVTSCVDGTTQSFKCQWVPESYGKDLQYSQAATLRFANQILCSNTTFGDGPLGYIGRADCDKDKTGEITAECMANAKYENVQDRCVLKEIQNLLDLSVNLTPVDLPPFLKKLSDVTKNTSAEINQSPATIGAVVKILDNVANVNTKVDQLSMTFVLETAGILTRDDSKNSWNFLNNNDTKTVTNTTSLATSNSRSSLFLDSLERLSGSLSNNSFVINVPSVLLNKTTFTNNFNFDFNSSVAVDIPQSVGGNKSLTVIVFSSMDNVLPPRDQANSSVNLINGQVTLIRSSGKINNISLTFDVLNDTLSSPKCVYWNFSLFNGLGGWDTEGCFLVYNENGTVSCSCNHLTSFSILMSPFAPDIPELAYITYVGIALSMISLVICLIIEAIIWHRVRKNSTSWLRHVSILNIALSLLIADIWFIIAANISDPGRQNAPACTAATFFIHFFYLAMFFWMLSSALLLVYRTLSVFGGLSDLALLGIGFALGYGAPLIIASITIAITAGPKQYIQKEVCWLNWFESKALLAFVIPALSIVCINLIILAVILYKILRRRVGSNSTQEGEKHVLMVIAKSLAVLTPIFGLTWGLGIGTMVDPRNKGVHIAFAFFNSLQGFFILVFGVLLDKKVLQDLRATSQSIFSGTKSTSGGNSSSIFGFLKRNGRGGGISNSGSSTGHSFGNT
ncbi:adhesion G protein-coupled receptor F5 isoform X2 [Oryzias latipes]